MSSDGNEHERHQHHTEIDNRQQGDIEDREGADPEEGVVRVAAAVGGGENGGCCDEEEANEEEEDEAEEGCYKEEILRLSSTVVPPSPPRPLRRQRNLRGSGGSLPVVVDAPGTAAAPPSDALPPARSGALPSTKGNQASSRDRGADNAAFVEEQGSGGESDASSSDGSAPRCRPTWNSAASSASSSGSDEERQASRGAASAAAAAAVPPSSTSLTADRKEASDGVPHPLPALEAVPTAAAVRIPSAEFHRIQSLHEAVVVVPIDDDTDNDNNDIHNDADADETNVYEDNFEDAYESAGPPRLYDDDVRRLQETVSALQVQLLQQNEIVATLRQSLLTLSSSSTTATDATHATPLSSSDESLPSSTQGSSSSRAAAGAGAVSPKPQTTNSTKGEPHQVVITSRRLYLLLGIGFAVTIATMLAIVLPLTLLPRASSSDSSSSSSSSGSDETFNSGHDNGQLVPTPTPSLMPTLRRLAPQAAPDAGKWVATKVPSSMILPPSYVPYPSPPSTVDVSIPVPTLWPTDDDGIIQVPSPPTVGDDQIPESSPVMNGTSFNGDNTTTDVEPPGFGVEPVLGNHTDDAAAGGGINYGGGRERSPTGAPTDSDSDEEATTALRPSAVAGISVAAVVLAGGLAAALLVWHWYRTGSSGGAGDLPNDGADTDPNRLLPLAAAKEPSAASLSASSTGLPPLPPSRWPASVTSVDLDEEDEEFDIDINDGDSLGNGGVGEGGVDLRARIERLRSRVADRSEMARRLAVLVDEQQHQHQRHGQP